MNIQQEARWLIGRVLERDGITTQGRYLDELVLMVRDAIALMWNEKNVQLELILPSNQRRRAADPPHGGKHQRRAQQAWPDPR